MKKSLPILMFLLAPFFLLADTTPRVKILNGQYTGEYSRNNIRIIKKNQGIKITDGCFSRLYRPNRRGVLTDRSGSRQVFILAPGVVELTNRRGRSEIYVKRGHQYRNNRFTGNRNQLRIQGTWQNDRLRRSLEIVPTRNGIKARDLNDRRWTRYTSSVYAPNEYTDNRGNRIIIASRNRLSWIGFRGKEIRFRR